MAGRYYEETPQEREKNAQVDVLARQAALSWRAGDLDEERARHRIYMLILETTILARCSAQQSPWDSTHKLEDMYDYMLELLERKCLVSERAGSVLDLDLVADGHSVCGWARTTLNGAGVYGRKRIARSEQQRLRRVARASDATEMGLTHPDSIHTEESSARLVWSAQARTTEDQALESLDETPGDLPVPTEALDETETAYPDLVESGNRNAARAAAFAANGSSYRGAHRLRTQVALISRVYELPPPQRVPLSRREDRQTIRQWCLDNPKGTRLHYLFAELRAGREVADQTPAEDLVLSLFEWYSMSEAAILATQPGYVLVHLAQSAVEPAPPPRHKTVAKMISRLGESVGAKRARRLVKRWAEAHSELTVSEHSGRGAEQSMKSVEQAEVDEDLFSAEVSKLFEDSITVFGQSLDAVRHYLEELYENLMVEELDSQVDEWVSSAQEAFGEEGAEPQG